MDITTEELRAALNDAWDARPRFGNSLRNALRGLETAARTTTTAGSLLSSSANGRNVQFPDRSGAGMITGEQATRKWRMLLDQFGETLVTLNFWAARGIDPYFVEQNGCSSNPPAVTGKPPVIIDTYGQWANDCLEFGIDPATVIGADVSLPQKQDPPVYVWMLDHLTPVTEARSDYGSLRINRGMQWV